MQISYLCNSSLLGFPFIISSHLVNPDLWLFKIVSLQISFWVLAALCSADCKMISMEKPFKHRYHLIWFTSLIKVIEFLHFLPALVALQCLQLIVAYVFSRVYNFYLWESWSDIVYFIVVRVRKTFLYSSVGLKIGLAIWKDFGALFTLLFWWLGMFWLCKPLPVSMGLQVDPWLTLLSFSWWMSFNKNDLHAYRRKSPAVLSEDAWN